MITTYNGSIPVIPLRNAVLFPGTTLPLKIARSVSKASIGQAEKDNRQVIVVAEKTIHDEDDVTIDNLYKFGTLSRLEKVKGSDADGYVILVNGTSRFKVTQYELSEDGSLSANGEVVDDQSDVDQETTEMLIANIKSITQDTLNLLPIDTKNITKHLESISDLGLLTNLCALNLALPLENKQELLETLSLKQRALRLLELMHYHKNSLQLQSEIGSKLSDKMTKSQREAILREQLNTIREELGEGDSTQKNDNYRAKIKESKMPDEIEKIALDELHRLESLGNNSPEAHVIRNYLDLMCAMPWATKSSKRINLKSARNVLHSDHYGLDKIKERIIEHLAVMKLKKDGMGSILLLVGPPGVGKTSLGQSIARALGRKFVRASLGGVRDDAEIRGHRRTYIGAMPGRVIQEIKRAGVNDPVFVLDEVDKLAYGYNGDPASALLEVLDPEQNSAFVDHFLDVPFDLSQVFFILTANSLEGIPGPLRDRMEIIELSGYTTREKSEIARNHLIPKQLKIHGIKASQLTIDESALLHITNAYTREAGVRELQRHVAALCRASAERVLGLKRGQKVLISKSDLEEILGTEKYFHEVAERTTIPGVVTGLAWTPMGGDILFIEGSLMPGTGRLTLTGQLGDVMKESANISLSLVRSNLSLLMPGFNFNHMDIHIHVPSGAIPKDGPSAGITMMTAIASLVTGTAVSPELAMTGEITLRGIVMPVGGIKEKLLAAHRAGIKRVLLPGKNRKDLRDVPTDVTSQLDIEYVDSINDVMRLALNINSDEVFRSDQNIVSYPSLVGVN